MTKAEQSKAVQGSLWKVTREIVRTYRGRFLQMTALLAVGSVLEIAGIGFLVPLLSNLFGANLLEGSQLEKILHLAGLSGLGTGGLLVFILIFMSARTALLYESNRIAGVTSVEIEKNLRQLIFRTVMEARWDYTSALKTGWISNLATQEAGQAGYAIQFLARFYVASFLSAAFFLAAIVFSLPAFILTVIVTVPLLLIGRVLNKKTRHVSEQRVEFSNTGNAHIIEALAQAKLVKSTDSVAESVARQQGVVADLARVQNKNIHYLSLMATLPDAFLLIALVFIVAMSQIFRLSAPADFIFFLLLMIRAQRFIGQAQSFQQRAVSLLPSYTACRTLISSAEKAREDLREGGEIPAFGESIELERVGFYYRPGLPVLRGLSLTIPCRATVALAGRSGSGKTTLIDLLTGLLTPSEGRVLVDGRGLAAINLHAWRRKIAYVPQDPVLFNGTLRENITRDSPPSPERFSNVVRLAHVDEFAQKLPNGYDTLVGERGMFFSGGQKQRIALARALMRNPEILILDEATSALDTISEEQIKQSLLALKNSMTIIVIAHRLSTIREADQIFVLEEGRLVQQGSYEELTAQDGLFGRLAQQGLSG